MVSMMVRRMSPGLVGGDAKSHHGAPKMTDQVLGAIVLPMRGPVKRRYQKTNLPSSGHGYRRYLDHAAMVGTGATTDQLPELETCLTCSDSSCTRRWP
jgi:hypothetical protein